MKIEFYILSFFILILVILIHNNYFSFFILTIYILLNLYVGKIMKKSFLYARIGDFKNLESIQKKISLLARLNFKNSNEIRFISQNSTPNHFINFINIKRKDCYFFRKFSKSKNDKIRYSQYFFYEKLEEICFVIINGSNENELNQFIDQRNESDNKKIERSNYIKKKFNYYAHDQDKFGFLEKRYLLNYYYISKALDFYLDKDYLQAYYNLYEYVKLYPGDYKKILLVFMYVCAKKINKNIEDDISEQGKLMLENALLNEEFKEFVNRELC